MKKEEKCVEYFFDSKEYNKEDIIENIKQEEKEFEKKKFEINISLNEYGVYVVHLKLLNNKLAIIKKANHNKNLISKDIVKKEKVKPKPKYKNKIRKTYNGYETYSGTNKKYGQYKTTKIFEPI